MIKKATMCLMGLVFSLPTLLAGNGQAADTVATQEHAPEKLGFLKRIIRGFDKIDTAYIEPQHYNYTVMLQATYNFDRYSISGNGQSVTLAPDPLIEMGPYIGWRWVFLGYTFDLKNIGFSKGVLKRDFELSIYSSQIGVDLFHRKSGQDYKLRQVSLSEGHDIEQLEGMPFDGISVGTTGIDAYYIFNHEHFSYPAAFSQSTLQKISCGSWIAGAGYRQNRVELDYGKLQNAIDRYGGSEELQLDSALMFNKIKYQDFNLSGGYAWNLVFAKHCLFCASAQAVLAYKKSQGSMVYNSRLGFIFDNVNVDAVGRFALVYNNMRWYAGASAILHTNNYRTPRFRTSNIYGNVNLYIGYNFGLRKRFKNKT